MAFYLVTLKEVGKQAAHSLYPALLRSITHKSRLLTTEPWLSEVSDTCYSIPAPNCFILGKSLTDLHFKKLAM